MPHIAGLNFHIHPVRDAWISGRDAGAALLRNQCAEGAVLRLRSRHFIAFPPSLIPAILGNVVCRSSRNSA